MRSSAPQRRIRKSARLARAHWHYTTEDVQKLYGVSAATVSNWIRYGLIAIEANRRLFRGSDLNSFHSERNKAAKQPCAKDEVFCVHCKRKHSLLKEPFGPPIRSHVMLEVSITCPETGGTAKRFIRESDLDELRQQLESQSSLESPH